MLLRNFIEELNRMVGEADLPVDPQDHGIRDTYYSLACKTRWDIPYAHASS